MHRQDKKRQTMVCRFLDRKEQFMMNEIGIRERSCR